MQSKILILLCCFCGILVCCNQTNKKNGGSLKNEELRKNEFGSYAHNDTLVIYDNNKHEVVRLQVTAVDSLCIIDQKQENNFLFFALSPNGDTDYTIMGLVDTKKNKVIVNKNCVDCIPNTPSYIGSSIDGKYHIIEGGTASQARTLQVYNSNGEIVKECSYFSDVDKNELQWNATNSFYYYEIAETVPDSLPKPKENYNYVVKKVWQNKKDSITNDFKEVYFE